MTSWVEKNWKGDFTGMWDQAQKVWSNVDVQNQMALWSIDQQKEQNFKDIREGLLATLKGYQGTPEVKRIFEDAIKDLEY
jgi:ATP sulfurylase